MFLRVALDPVSDPALAPLMARLPDEGAALVARAFTVAQAAHAGQIRRQGTPYIDHLVEVAQILAGDLGVSDPAILAAGLLHDAVEDSPLTVEDLGAFPRRTRELVALLTDPEPAMTGRARRAHFREIWKDPDATVLKAADRLSNIRDVVAQGDPAFTRRYVRRTRREIVGPGLPLAQHPVAAPLLRAALEEADPDRSL
jgi:(p)ppGpp synthase/HD superfamily hydrolase